MDLFDSAYSTTRLVSRERPVIEERTEAKFKSLLFLPPNACCKGEGGLRMRGLFKQPLPDKPLITIITAVFNEAQVLEKAILGVMNQKYNNIEYIIIDGDSTDGAVDVIREYEQAIDYWVSEPDTGIYDAWNKGVRLATGQYIAFLGAGDVYDDQGLEKLVACALAHPEADFISSKIAIVRDGAIQRVLGSAWEWWIFRRRMNTAHPGSLHSRRLFDKFGEFDTSYRIAGDYEYLLRARDTLNTAYVDEVTVKVVAGGVSQIGYRVFQEAESAKIKNRSVSPWVARIDRCILQTNRWIRSNLIK